MICLEKPLSHTRILEGIISNFFAKVCVAWPIGESLTSHNKHVLNIQFSLPLFLVGYGDTQLVQVY